LTNCFKKSSNLFIFLLKLFLSFGESSSNVNDVLLMRWTFFSNLSRLSDEGF